jgi:phospholipid/cholesterol/gamma-HCH transport system ATP-binding protein
MYSNNNKIKVSDLHKSFGQEEVLRGVNLELHEKENLVVLGRSGSGKSVLTKCIIGLLKPEKGDVEILGEKVYELKRKELHELRQHIGFLFQYGALYDSMTIEQNLRFPLQKTTDLKSQEIEERVDEALENVGLPETRKKMPAELSGGMQKRIALARALIMKPKLMFYDEPTSGLDTVTSREISNLILELQEKYQMSSLIITHDMASVKIVANRIIMLHDGKVQEEGTYKSLENSTKPFVKAFFE